MGPLTALSVSLLALKLGGVSPVGWGLIILPAALQGAYTLIQAYRTHRKLNKIMSEIQESLKKDKMEE